MEKALRLFALLAMVAAVFAAAPSAVAVPDGQRPCGEVTFDYSPSLSQAGEVMEWSMTIVNCSSRAERLRLHVKFSSACAFAHPVSHTYRLESNSGVGAAALFTAPSCAGHYAVHLKLTLLRHRPVLDTAHDGFLLDRHRHESPRDARL
jgi:hypothetical protein